MLYFEDWVVEICLDRKPKRLENTLPIFVEVNDREIAHKGSFKALGVRSNNIEGPVGGYVMLKVKSLASCYGPTMK